MIYDIGEAGVTMKSQPQTVNVARFCVRKKVEAEDAEDAELDSLRERFRHIGADLGSQPRQVDSETDTDVDWEDGNNASSSGVPESESGVLPEMVPVPGSPSLSVQLPSPRAPSEKRPHLEPSFDKARKPSQAPRAEGA